MKDISEHLGAVEREVTARSSDDGDLVAVILRRRFNSTPADVWDALTDPERLRRWFLPVSGDLRVGGHFSLAGNAEGDILQCEPPAHLRVTWGDATSIVEVRLRADGDDTAFELEHTVPIAMAGSGAGALFVGPGWDGAVAGLAMFLHDEIVDDPAAFANSLEVQELSRRSAHLWAAAVEASGTATPGQVAELLATSLAHFAPDVTDPGEQPAG